MALSSTSRPLAVDDLELLGALITYGVLNEPKDQNTLFHDHILPLMFRDSYVLYALLGISALRIYTKDRSRDDLMLRGTALQNMGLRQAHNHVASVTEEKSPAILVFSGITPIWVLAESTLNPHKPGQEDIVDDLMRFM